MIEWGIITIMFLIICILLFYIWRNRMTNISTDTYAVTISVRERGDAKIENVVAPTEVLTNTPFQIEYDCVNGGGTDTVWGHIKDVDKNEIIIGSDWAEEIVAGQTNHYVIDMPGIITTLNGLIEVGYVE